MRVTDFNMKAPVTRAALKARKSRHVGTGPNWTLFVAVGLVFPVVVGIVALGLLAKMVDGILAALRPPPTPVK